MLVFHPSPGKHPELLTVRQIIISFLVNLPDLFCLLHAPHPTQVHIIHAFSRALLDAGASALLLVSYVMWQVFSCDYDENSDGLCDRDDLVDASYQLSLFLSYVPSLSFSQRVLSRVSILHVIMTFFDFIALCQRSDVLGSEEDDEDVW
jgi:hypothetical protein